jgi:hypothetical protein
VSISHASELLFLDETFYEIFFSCRFWRYEVTKVFKSFFYNLGIVCSGAYGCPMSFSNGRTTDNGQ